MYTEYIIKRERNMKNQFTVYTNPEFDFDLLPQFAKEHGCTYSIDFDEGYTVTFFSKNINYLEEVSDQLSFLEQTSITE